MDPPQHNLPTALYHTAEVVYLLSRGALHMLEPPHMIQVKYPASHQRGPQLQGNALLHVLNDCLSVVILCDVQIEL